MTEHLPLRPVDLLILLALNYDEQHGYAIVQEVERRAEGTVRLHPGALYRMLHRMLDHGLLAESATRPAPEMDDARRRYYRITPLGRGVLAAELARLERLVRSPGSRANTSRPLPA